MSRCAVKLPQVCVQFLSLTAGSKRYQMEEREKVGQWCTTQNGRNARDREQALSKQTAQRQK